MSYNSFYTGRGSSDPTVKDRLPTVDPRQLRDPKDYRASLDLAAAVNVALTLGMPLLLTGEPGSGKSDLAYSLAWEIELGAPLQFVVKSDTESRDLFYRFDTVGRFHAAQTRIGDKAADEAAVDPARFIAFDALGKAILLAKPKQTLLDLGLPEFALGHPGEPQRSVVLIDEIDKAPRDVPNDILVEIANMQFDIPELAGAGRGAVRVKLDGADRRYWPIVIFTSNSEKALPEPFLRRCVYHHVEFPRFQTDPNSDDVTVEIIVQARLGDRYASDRTVTERIGLALDLLRYLRDEQRGLERRPTLAEFLNWLDYLMPQQPVSKRTVLAALGEKGVDSGAERQLIDSVKNLLLKKPGDQKRAEQLLDEWRAARPRQGAAERKR